ncbi:MAG TPA: immunoglobulin domain-containing protein [Verrucomicrobiae bacterium]|jgi:hypothetical protein
MKLKLIHSLAIAIAGVCISGLNAGAVSTNAPSTYKNITIDGSFDDWTGVPLAYNQPQLSGDVVQYQNLYVANDDDYLYVRFTLYTPADPFTSGQNYFVDVDTNYNTGDHEHGIGSDLFVQSGVGYYQAPGTFNAGAAGDVGWLSAPAAPASDFEYRISRHTLGINGLPMFTNNTVALYLESGESSGSEWFPNFSSSPLAGLTYTFAPSSAILTTNLALVGLSNSSWEVNPSGTDLGTNWLGQTYDDSPSPWISGLGLFGYTPSGAYPTIQTPLSSGPNTYYFRTHFTWNYSTINLAFVVTNYLSDGAVYYLNGVEVRRDRMPAGNVAYGTAASGTNSPVGQPDIFGFSGGPLQIGDNILEVETHQAPGSGSDMVFGLSLTAATQYPATIVNTNLPADQSVPVGQSVTFTADVLGSSLSYQWLEGGAPIAGATNAVFVIPFATTNDSGGYSLTVANSLATNTTRTAMLSVLNTPVVITNQPADQYVLEGHPTTLTVSATGSYPLGYQWFFNDNIISNATNASYSIAFVNSTNAGNYYVTVSNPTGPINSRTAVLTELLDIIPPAVTNVTATASKILLTFSEPVDSVTAGNPAYYTLSSGWTVSNVVVNSANQVTITPSLPFNLGTLYSVTVNGVKDLFGNAANTTVSFTTTIVIDGKVDDWQGIAPIYDNPTPGNDGAADFKDIYVYNDDANYYFRATLWHDIPGTNGFFPKYADMYFNTDNDINTGYEYGFIGSELLHESSAFYQEKLGNKNDESSAGAGPIVGLNYLIAPTVAETNFPADFEWKYSRNATFADGTPVFPTNVISFLWEGSQIGYLSPNNFAPADGASLIYYTNAVPLSVPGLPLGQLAIYNVTGGKIALAWDPPGTLQCNSSLGGNSWTNMPGATSPYIIPSSNGQQFFRLAQ